MSESTIPFHRPTLSGKEIEYLTQAVQSRKIVGDGPFAKRCAELISASLGGTKVYMMPSCTAALEMGAVLSQVGPGDAVIMPSFTFVSTANAVVLRGATPVFVDVRRDTMNIDESKIEAAITSRTKAISVVHYAGVSCEMDEILAIARKHNLLVVEDAAQGVHASYKGKPLGGIGDIGCFSFHETKNFVSGEGGAISINSQSLLERAEIVREKGTNRGRFLRGQVDKYTWVDIGSSWLPSDLACAFLLAQLEVRDEITEARQRIYEFYKESLGDLERNERLTLPIIPAGCESNYHLFHLLAGRVELADGLMTHLRAKGIGAVSHYVPLHTSPMGRELQKSVPSLPVTETASSCLVRLPLHGEMTRKEAERVVDEVQAFFKSV